MMKKVLCLVGLAALIVLTGCESEKISSTSQDTTVATSQDTAQADQVAALQAQLKTKDTKLAQLKKQITTLMEKNTEIQTTAMDSISSMLKKEQERANKLSTSLQIKDRLIKQLKNQLNAAAEKTASLEKTISDLNAKLQALKSEIPAQ